MTARVWTVAETLAWIAGHLGEKGIDDPRRSAEWLLSAATGLSRVELYAYHDRPLTEPEREALRESVRHRAAGEPLQYATGEMPFRHLVLKVSPGVFIPRPETEVLVDAALEGLGDGDGPFLALDLCTGSGAVALSIAHERAGARVHATDLSPAAVEVARGNAERCGLAGRVTVHEGDLFAPLPDDLQGKADVVTANPPYVPSADLAGLPAEVGEHEPALALDGGPDGLDVVRRIARDARAWLRPGGWLVMETDTDRAKDAAAVTAEWYEDSEVLTDLTGRDRIVRARLR